ncbi:MAG: glycine cleavage system protein T, partial [Cellulomonadaceae bacterium]
MTDAAPRRTPLTAEHEALGATLTPFGGWLMPLRYAGETAEHRAVRTAAGLFDLSHMGEISVTGPDAGAFLDVALVGAISGIRLMGARYSMIVAEDGGVLDDLIVYHNAENEYLVVANAANSDTVVSALTARTVGFDVSVADGTDTVALIGVQGPRALEVLEDTAELTPSAELSLGGSPRELRYYSATGMGFAGSAVLVARTGYTGEDGFELFVDAEHAVTLWRALLAAGARHGLVPAGLSARDSLRLEAGMPLYGH